MACFEHGPEKLALAITFIDGAVQVAFCVQEERRFWIFCNLPESGASLFGAVVENSAEVAVLCGKRRYCQATLVSEFLKVYL